MVRPQYKKPGKTPLGSALSGGFKAGRQSMSVIGGQAVSRDLHATAGAAALSESDRPAPSVLHNHLLSDCYLP